MNTLTKIRRPVAIALLAMLATASVTPLAEAGRKNRRHRDRDVRVEHRVVVRPVERRVVVRRPHRAVRVVRRPHATYTVWRRSSHGEVIAGFLGGIFLGATLANAAPHGFTYWDPYCHRGFASLEVYYSHCSHHRHDRRIEVVEVPYGHDRGDVRYCEDCDEEYWGDDHDCG